MARTKMTRHQLKEQDEFTTFIQRFTDFLYDRKKEVLAGALIVVVLALAIVGWSFYSSNRNANAQTQLSAAINIFADTAKPDKERYEQTIVEAQKTYDNYRSLPAGIIAKYYIGLSHDGLGNTNAAVEDLQEVIERGDASVKAVAQFALGGIHRKNGETQKAIEIYKQLYDGGGYSKAAVAYELATLYEAGNQLDEAKDYYQKVVTDTPDSPFRQPADDALKRLGVTIPPPPAQKPS